MKNKLIYVALSSATAAMLIGCGGGSSSVTSTTLSGTNGKIIDGTVTDKNGKIGIQVMDNGKYTNKYTFTGDFEYPVSITDGYVDVNDNGELDAGIDYKFTGKLVTFNGTAITPITTYLGDPDDENNNYDEKLESLKTLTGAEEDDLINEDPFDLLADNEKVYSASLAIRENYSALMDTDTENDNITEDETALKDKFDDYVDSMTGSTDSASKYTALQNQLITALAPTLLTEEDVKASELPEDSEYEEWPVQGATNYADMKSDYLATTNSNWFQYGDNTFVFNSDNTICEKDSGGTDGTRADYTCSSSTGTWEEIAETMVATMYDGGKFYAKVIDGNVWTAYSDDAESSDSDSSSDSESSDSTAYALQSSDIEDKKITFDIGESLELYSDNTGLMTGSDYSETFTWTIVDGQLKITLEDNVVDYAIFVEAPKVGTKVTYNLGDGATENRTITSIADTSNDNSYTGIDKLIYEFDKIKEIIEADELGYTAVFEDNSIVTWTTPNKNILLELDNVKKVVTEGMNSFAALTYDGALKFAVDSDDLEYKEFSSGIIDIINAEGKFIALKDDGSISLLEINGSEEKLTFKTDSTTEITNDNFVKILPNGTFIKNDGSIINYSSTSTYVGTYNTSINFDDSLVDIYSEDSKFAALFKDGSVYTWDGYWDGVYEDYTNNIEDVSKVFPNYVLKKDGSVVAWNSAEIIPDSLSSGVVDIIHNGSINAYAALKSDGSVVTWGNSYYGGDSSKVADKLTTGVVDVKATQFSFAALKSDGSVVRWGQNSENTLEVYPYSYYSSAPNLDSGVKSIISSYGTFAALKDNGTFVLWGVATSTDTTFEADSIISAPNGGFFGLNNEYKYLNYWDAGIFSIRYYSTTTFK